MYLYHPPFKRLSPVSDVYEASSSASRSHFLVPPPPTPLRIQQWQSDHVPVLLSLPILLLVGGVELDQLLPLLVPDQLLHLLSAPPLSPPFAGNTYLKQEISKSKYFFSPLLNLKLNQVFKVMFIYRFITMICYEIL